MTATLFVICMTTRCDSLPQPQCAFGPVEEEVAGAEQVFKQHDAKPAVLCAACLVLNAAQRWLQRCCSDIAVFVLACGQ